MLRTIVALVVASFGALAQVGQDEFVLDGSKPYVYLEFDHVAPRRPIKEGEPPTGLWLRIVNNCRVGIRIGTFGSSGDDAGIGVLHEVVPYAHRVRVEVQYSVPMVPAEPEPADEQPRPAKPTPPEGYWAEVHSTTRIGPGESVLFSVPTNHVGEKWFMRVLFTLDVSRPRVGNGPYSYVDFSETQIPRRCLGVKECGFLPTPARGETEGAGRVGGQTN
jgi:hypothetical protein